MHIWTGRHISVVRDTGRIGFPIILLQAYPSLPAKAMPLVCLCVQEPLPNAVSPCIQGCTGDCTEGAFILDVFVCCHRACIERESRVGTRFRGSFRLHMVHLICHLYMNPSWVHRRALVNSAFCLAFGNKSQVLRE